MDWKRLLKAIGIMAGIIVLAVVLIGLSIFLDNALLGKFVYVFFGFLALAGLALGVALAYKDLEPSK